MTDSKFLAFFKIRKQRFEILGGGFSGTARQYRNNIHGKERYTEKYSVVPEKVQRGAAIITLSLAMHKS